MISKGKFFFFKLKRTTFFLLGNLVFHFGSMIQSLGVIISERAKVLFLGEKIIHELLIYSSLAV